MSTLTALNARYANCQACNLSVGRSCVVLGEGPLSPKAMFIGEGPGFLEDQAGRPFVGRAGAKLDQIIKWLGLSREDVYISNAVLCRPPQNRTPTMLEILSCRSRLLEEITLVNPKLLVILGRSALNSIMGMETKQPLRSYMKDFLLVNVANRSYHVAVACHPSFHVRVPKAAWDMTGEQWLRIKQYVS